ncbi:hypothetical protein QUF72_20690 [Desulfobacterales bacterium HSG2]|nr:hypothetical protein [Desulfobacterales bacterium HSG2]
MPNPSHRTWHFHRLLGSDCQIRAATRERDVNSSLLGSDCQIRLGTFIACSARIAKSEPPDLAIRRERERRLGLLNPSRRTWHFHRLLNSDCQIRAAGFSNPARALGARARERDVNSSLLGSDCQIRATGCRSFITGPARIAKSGPPDLAIRRERESDESARGGSDC